MSEEVEVSENKGFPWVAMAALFYSTAIGTVMNFLIQQLNYQENLIVGIIVNIITTVLFLFFYFSGEEKEQHIKKAITIVQVAWLVIGIVLSTAFNALASNMLG
ncbi:hypothetical protein [Marinilactibacillus psychrotolerans]|uniref:Uncharacterized protein n=1 Tax=Marinilactibacillus psychrotolerans TaxID=191770 RepID=A0ABW8UQQ5_9LACT